MTPAAHADAAAPEPQLFEFATGPDLVAMAGDYVEQRERERDRPGPADLTSIPDSEAVEVLTSTNARLLKSSVEPPADVVRYVDPSTAVVDVPGSPDHALLQATVPLVDEDESGEGAPVDLDLEREGGSIEPGNPVVPVELPAHADDSVALREVGITLEDAEPAEAEIVRETSVYPNVAPDSDYLAKAIPNGLEVSLQLRSAESPERFDLGLELPDGATVEAGAAPGEPAARIVDSAGEELASVAQPIAWDATGEQVTVEMSVEGDSLVIDVRHRVDEVAYPVIVDPSFQESLPHPLPDANSGWNGYAAQPSHGSYGMHVAPGYGYRYMEGYAQFNWPPWLGLYYNGNYAAWYWNAPGTETRITRFWVYNLWHWPNGTSLQAGVLHACWCAWQGSSFSSSSQLSNYSAASFADGAATTGNLAYVRVIVNGDGWRSVPSGAQLLFQGAFGGTYMQLQDDTAPSGISMTAPPAAMAGWAASGTWEPVVSARDNGVGMKRFQLRATGDGGAAVFTRTRNRSCSNTTTNPCPRGTTVASNSATSGDGFAINLASMPEGIITLGGRAADLAGATANTNWSGEAVRTLKVDRTAPQVNLGPTQNALGDGHIATTRSVPVSTSDPQADGSGPSAGVTKAEVKVDGSVVATYTQTCPSNSCELNRTFSLDPTQFSDGAHTMTVVATDAAGNTRTSSPVTFRIGWPETTITDGPAALTNSDSASFAFTSDRAGATFECRIDSGTWGGCTSPQEYSDLADGEHTFSVRATTGQSLTDATPATRSWTVDTVSPTADVACPDDESWYGEDTACSAEFADSESGLAKTESRTRTNGGEWSQWVSTPDGAAVNVSTEGVTDIEVRATDAAGNTETASRAVGVDRTQPSLDISDAIDDARGVIHQPAEMAIVAAEPGGSPGGGAGVTDIEITIDGEVAESFTQECPNGGCSMNETWTLDPADYATGDHTVDVRAIDATGNSSSQPLSLTSCGDEPGESVHHVECLTARANPQAIDPAEEVETFEGEMLQPEVEPAVGGQFQVEGTAVDTEIAVDSEEGFTLGTDSGDVTFAPVGVEDDAVGAAGTADSTVIFPETEDGAHSIVRPQPDGVETFTTITEGAPTSYSWEVDLQGDEEVVELDSGAVEIVDPTPEVPRSEAGPVPNPPEPLTEEEVGEAIEDGDVSPEAQAPDPQADAEAAAAVDEAGDDESPFEDDLDIGLPPDPEGTVIPDPPPDESELPGDPDAVTPTQEQEIKDDLEDQVEIRQVGAQEDAGEGLQDIYDDVEEEREADQLESLNQPVVVAKIHAPSSVDADHEDIPTTLSVEGDTVTMSVDTTGATFPIVADPWITVMEYYTEWVWERVERWEPYVKGEYPRWWPLWPGNGQWWIRHSGYPAHKWSNVRQGQLPGYWRVNIGWMITTYEARHAYFWYLEWLPDWGRRKVVVREQVPRLRSRPKARWYDPVHWFGYNEAYWDHRPSEPTRRGRYFHLAKEGKANIIRTGVRWSKLQPSYSPNPPTDWGFDGQALKDAKAKGLSAIVQIGDVPGWARGDPGSISSHLPPTSEYEDEYRNFIRGFLVWAKGEGLTNTIAALEIGNEPNKPVFWNGANQPVSATEYARKFMLAREGLKSAPDEARQGIKLLSAGLSPETQGPPPYPQYPGAHQGDRIGGDYLRDFLNAVPDNQHPDGIAIHIYANRKDVDHVRPNIRDDFEEFKWGLHAGGARGTPFWVTELGYPILPYRDQHWQDCPPAGVVCDPTYIRKQERALSDMFGFFSEQPDRLRPEALVFHRLLDDPNPPPEPGQAPYDSNLEKRLTGTVFEPGTEIRNRKYAYCRLAELAKGVTPAGGCPDRPRPG